MKNPKSSLAAEGRHPTTYMRNPWDPTNEPHCNSTVLSHWFYLVCEGGSETNDLGNLYDVSGIGINKAERIAYRALAYYLNSSANYNAARNATIQAASYIYGDKSPEVISVYNAWHAVGVGDRHPTFITGPTFICSTNTTPFILNNADIIPDNNIVWTSSSNLQPQNGNTGKTKIFKATGNGTGWVNATVGAQVTSFNVWSGKPTDIEIDDGPTSINTGANAQYRTKLVNGGSASRFEHEWSISPNYGYSGYYPNMNNLSVTFNTSGTYTITVKAKNECGMSSPDSRRTVVRSSYYSAYPNPASNVLNIEIDQEAITQAKSMEQTATGAKQISIQPTYDIRLYDGQGNLLQRATTKGGKVEFNVANLSNGIYYLHIYDGVNEKPKMRQIMVEH